MTRKWFHNLREGGISRTLAAGVRARIFPGTNLMLSVVELDPWSESPVHTHANEQWGLCIEGEWIRIQDAQEYAVKAGDFWETPPNVPHGGRSLAHRCVILDIFSPPREEYRLPGTGLGASSAPRSGAETREEGTADPGRPWLRHAVATLAYRAGKVLRNAPAGFGAFRFSETTLTPGEILAHIGDLLDWALSIARGQQEWHTSTPRPWEVDVKRFYSALGALDAYLASDAPLHGTAGRLFQGPIADALTHVGQIATRRRLAGAPVRGENYFLADIVPGRVGPEQAPPRREFD